jgi:hypothetical protein
MRWCTFLEGDLSDSYKHSLQRMPWSQKKHNGVCKWILINLKWCWNLLAEGTIFFWVCIRVEGLFPTITTVFFWKQILQRECTKSGHSFFQEYHVFWKIRLGITDIGGLYVKTNAEPMCFILFQFSALFLKRAKFFRTLDENRWHTKLPSTHAQVSEHRPELAGVMMYDVVWTGLIRINPD